MFKRLLIIFVLLLIVCGVGNAQVGKKYIWADSIYTTVTAIDSNFTIIWEQAIIKSDTIDMWLRIGSEADTSNWSYRDWIPLDAGESLEIGPGTKLQRLQWKANSGVGHLFIIGYKRVKRGNYQ